MKIVNRPPKLYWLVRLFYPDYDFNKITAFTFGDTIYTRFSELGEHHIVHEATHIKQVRGSRLISAWFFLRYRFSPKFRYKCELEAYRNELRWLVRHYPGRAGEFLDHITNALSDKLIYKNMVSRDRALFDLLA